MGISLIKKVQLCYSSIDLNPLNKNFFTENYQKLRFFQITQMSETHSRDVLLFRPYVGCLWFDLAVLYGFATYTLYCLHSTFPSFQGGGFDFKELSFSGPCGPCFIYFKNTNTKPSIDTNPSFICNNIKIIFAFL